MADEEDPETPDTEEDEFISGGDFVVSVNCGENGHITVAVPSYSDPNLIGHLLDLAVSAVGKLKTQMQ